MANARLFDAGQMDQTSYLAAQQSATSQFWNAVRQKDANDAARQAEDAELFHQLLLGALVFEGARSGGTTGGLKVWTAELQGAQGIPPPPETTTYDARSGSRYTTSTSPDGSSTTTGINIRTGSRWSATTEANGRTHGHDAKGNYWTYDPATNTYYNYGTGMVCAGDGGARFCQ
jgi:hypothetical protein